MVLIAALLIGWSYWADADRRAFVDRIQTEEHRTTAVVTSKTWMIEVQVDPEHDHSITVEYTDHNNRRVLAENFVSKEFYIAAERGDRLPLWYLDGDSRDYREWMLDPA